MRKILVNAAVAATIVVATPAIAAPGIAWQPNSYTVPDANATVLFNGYSGQPASSTGVAYVPAAGSGQTVSGTVRLFTNGTSNGSTAADPSVNTDTGNFLVIGTGGKYTVNFATPVQYLSFIIGTIDDFNKLVLTDTNNMTYTYSGLQIIGQAAVGQGSNNSISGTVSYYFNGGAGLKSAVFSSTGSAFEIDQLASAVPEPAAWAMMIAGFGAVGGTLRRTRRRAPRGFATA